MAYTGNISDKKSKKAIVTGGYGFIGSCLIRHLINLDWKILNIDKLSYSSSRGGLNSVFGCKNYSELIDDVKNIDKHRNLISEFSPDVVFHLAAETHVDRSIDGPENFIESNINGTFFLLEFFLGYWRGIKGRDFRFMHISTDEVYGSLELNGGGAFNEGTRYAPSSPYSASKAASDHLVAAWFKTYGMPNIICNCSNNYGPFQFPEKLIPLMIINLITGRPLPVYGTGQNVRDWLFVGDHVRALEAIYRNGIVGEQYNIGGGNQISNINVVTGIFNIMRSEFGFSNLGNFNDHVSYVADRPGHDLRYEIDDRKLRTDLGWRPTVNFDDGLKKTVSWYLENREWWAEIIKHKYDGKRLGLEKM